MLGKLGRSLIHAFFLYVVLFDYMDILLGVIFIFFDSLVKLVRVRYGTVFVDGID